MENIITVRFKETNTLANLTNTQPTTSHINYRDQLNSWKISGNSRMVQYSKISQTPLPILNISFIGKSATPKLVPITISDTCKQHWLWRRGFGLRLYTRYCRMVQWDRSSLHQKSLTVIKSKVHQLSRHFCGFIGSF